jgi:broad specificity phosphatase PhoE
LVCCGQRCRPPLDAARGAGLTAGRGGQVLRKLGVPEDAAADIPLSPLGHAQARDLGAALAHARVSTILCSPYLRTLQTAQALLPALSRRRPAPVFVCT